MYKKGREAAFVTHEGGDAASVFRQIVEKYRSRVFHTAFGIIQNDEDARDITQEVFLKIFEKLDTFKGEARLSTWIHRITVNTCLDMLRKRKKDGSLPLREEIGAEGRGEGHIVASPPLSPYDATYHEELRGKIQEAFLRLSPEHRIVLVLREIEGLSYQEIAESLSCSIGTVMSRLHYARKKMQKLLAPVWGGSV